MTATTTTTRDLAAIGRDFRAACAAQEREGRNGLTQAERKLWKEAENACMNAGICWSCWANEGRRVKLSRWNPGNIWAHAGRECPECGEFTVCGEQPEYGDAGDEWRGDADPGL